VIRILLIEDDPRIQAIEAKYLRKVFGADCSLWIVDNAAAAVELLGASAPFDLVVSDYDLRYSNGGTVLAWVRANRPELLERYVFLSASTEPERIHDKVIDKLDIRELGDRLRALVPKLFEAAVAA
jgi:CheY-like chemotaxis protein